jgi:prophage maintenance system killer protein
MELPGPRATLAGPTFAAWLDSTRRTPRTRLTACGIRCVHCANMSAEPVTDEVARKAERDRRSRSSRSAARSRWTPSVDDFVELACAVSQEPPETVRRLPRLPLVEAALDAPFTCVDGAEECPTRTEQAAVLLERLAQHRPLPDGNERVAFLLMVRFLDANGIAWGSPATDADFTMVERIGAGDERRADVIRWIASRAVAK